MEIFIAVPSTSAIQYSSVIGQCFLDRLFRFLDLRFVSKWKAVTITLSESNVKFDENIQPGMCLVTDSQSKYFSDKLTSQNRFPPTVRLMILNNLN